MSEAIGIIVASFLTGFVGSLHCIGMCGPLVLAIPSDSRQKIRMMQAALIENSGRILTYVLLGVIFGLLGSVIKISGLQQFFSLSTGGVLLTLALSPKSLIKRFSSKIGWDSFVQKLSSWWAPLMRKKGLLSMFTLGLIHGLLPCGLVYVALATATSAGSAHLGGLAMLSFGVGTAPALLITKWVGVSFRGKLQGHSKSLIKISLVVLGLLFILRGASLGIPFLSPNLNLLGQNHACH